MQQDKFLISENILHPPATGVEVTPFIPKSPLGIRHGSAKSLRGKLEQAMDHIQRLEKMPSIESIPGLLPYQQIQLKKKMKMKT